MLVVTNKADWRTKSSRIRHLGLTPEAVRLLRELEMQANSSPWVFQTKDHGPLRNNLQRDFRVIVRRAGISCCTLHDLRRTFVSYLAIAGINEAIVQKLAGHASIQTTLKHYTHILPDSLRQAQDRLPYAGLGSKVSPECRHLVRLASPSKTA